MAAFEIALIIALALAVAVLAARLFLINKDIVAIRQDLERFDAERFNMNITYSSGDIQVEKLAVAINGKLQFIKDSVALYRTREDELRQSIANMGHDLRTPLTSVLGYMQLLRNEVVTDEGARYMAVMERRARTLETMINGFFELSMVEAPEYPLSLDAVDLTAALAQHLADSYSSFRSAGIVMNVDVPASAVLVYADAQAMDRIIANLLGNVLQHAVGNAVVKLSVQDSLAGLEITNGAPGLSSEEARRLFDRFYSADKVRREASGGLGLPIVKLLVEKMGGEVASSVSDGMLTIRLTLKACVGNRS